MSMTPAPNIFDAARYANVRRPTLEAEGLPPGCYTTQAFYEREVERIFRRCWNFIGREDEIPKPGDYLTLDLVGESIIVIRDAAHRARAFHNSCRHRGTRLLTGSGNCAAITCPYHSWVYAPSGALVACAGMEKTFNFDRAQYGLIPVRLESWDGFLFATFDPSAPDLKTYLGDLPALFAGYNLADMVCMRRREYDLACNWKIYLENAMEEYHTPTVHRQSIGSQSTVLDTGHRGEWDAIFMASKETIAVLAEDIGSAFPPIDGLTGRLAAGTYFTAIYPSTFFATTQDCMWWLQELPMGPGRTKVVIGSCFPRSTVALPDFAERVTKYYRRWDKSLPEDNSISERQQAGLASAYALPGRLSWHEPVVHRIANWVLDRVLDAEPASQSTRSS
jgi:choline monooxygenase